MNKIINCKSKLFCANLSSVCVRLFCELATIRQVFQFHKTDINELKFLSKSMFEWFQSEK